MAKVDDKETGALVRDEVFVAADAPNVQSASEIPADLLWVVAKLMQLHGRRFFGSFTVRFQEGKPSHVETSQVYKAPG